MGASEFGDFEAWSSLYERKIFGGSMATASLSAVRSSSGRAPITDTTMAERAGLMLGSALFTGLSYDECMEIASCASVRTFVRDEVLFMQGQSANHMVVIETGSVKLSQLGENGNEVILWLSGSGDPVTMHAECSGCSHTCSARAMEHCRALVWEYKKAAKPDDDLPADQEQHQPDHVRTLERAPGTVPRSGIGEGRAAAGACAAKADQASRQAGSGEGLKFPCPVRNWPR